MRGPSPFAAAFAGEALLLSLTLMGCAAMAEDWKLSGIDGRPVPDSAVTLRIEGERITGFDGCNSFNAVWRGGRVRAYETTLRACADPLPAQGAAEVSAVLSASPRLRREGDELIMSGGPAEFRFARGTATRPD